MSFYDWLYSNYPPDAVIDGRYGSLHIGVMVLCFVLIIGISFLRNSEKGRKWAIWTLAGMILFLELTRRGINLSRGNVGGWLSFLHLMLPRPWCAISCWLMIAAAFSRKRVLCNFSSMNALLCALVFFAYPSVGFNHKVILFENLYSIATHSLLIVGAVSMMTLGFTDFRISRKELLQTAGLLLAVYAYATAEILLKIEPDPLYFLPGNDVQDFLGVEHPLFLVIYIGFLAVYFSTFYAAQYLISHRHNVDASEPITNRKKLLYR